MKKLLFVGAPLALTALLTACPQPAVPQPTALSGKVSGWTSATAAVIQIEAVKTGAATGTAPDVLASATLATDGSFNLPLPTAAQVEPYLNTSVVGSLPSDCTGQFGTNAANKFFTVGQLHILQNGTGKAYADTTVMTGPTTSTDGTTATLTVSSTAWVYAKLGETLNGTVKCSYVSFGRTYSYTFVADAKLATGWNTLTLSGTGTTTTATGNAQFNFKLQNSSATTFDWKVVAGSQTQGLKF